MRSREVPFILEHGQIIGRLVYKHMAERPLALYGEGIGSNYQAQGLENSPSMAAHSVAMQSGAEFPSTSSARPGWTGLPVVVGAIAVLAFAAGLLWATQGGAVFFEAVTAGFAACF